ncbi:MAG: hypothetical protein ACYTFW_13425, partial [Planctomycetota bacterium]
MLNTRNAIAREIEELSIEPLLIVQTSPPEGMIVPAGPRNIGVCGLVPLGATATLNGRRIKNVRASGYFLQAHFMSDNNPTITVYTYPLSRQKTVLSKVDSSPCITAVGTEGARRATGVPT